VLREKRNSVGVDKLYTPNFENAHLTRISSEYSWHVGAFWESCNGGGEYKYPLFFMTFFLKL